jgi:hypothetical protein
VTREFPKEKELQSLSGGLNRITSDMEKGCHRVAREGWQDNGLCLEDRCKKVKVGQVYARGLGTLQYTWKRVVMELRERGCMTVA